MESSSHELDLRGLRCPLTWARARVHLEGVARGVEVVLLVDDPQSARDVPHAAETCGHHVIGVEADGSAWRIQLEV